MFYVDDLCVTAASLNGLQGLLNICTFDFENYVEYNPMKSVCMIVKPRGFHLKCLHIYMNLNLFNMFHTVKIMCIFLSVFYLPMIL